MIQKYLIFSACNTFLKNYCKKMNDKLIVAQKKGKERKLNTLMVSGVKDKKQKVDPLSKKEKKPKSKTSCNKNEKILTNLSDKSKKNPLKGTNSKPRKRTNDTKIIDLSIKKKKSKCNNTQAC